MNTKHLFFLTVVSIYACQSKPQAATSTITTQDTTVKVTATNTETSDTIDLEDATIWLTEVIESHLNDNGYAMEDICTVQYYEYKSDATGVGYDGGMEEAEFMKKWDSKYEVSHAGMGTAFLISGQDNGKVKVTKCNPKSSAGDIFEVVISDPEMKATYRRDIKIIAIGKAYQIDDVVEYD